MHLIRKQHLLAIAAITALTIGLPFVAAAEDAKEQAKVAAPKLIALQFHADWCGSCKTIDPRLAKARESLGDQPVLWITLDQTDKAGKLQSELMVSTLGLDAMYSATKKRTGFIVLLDAQTRKPVARITKQHDADQIVEAVKTALAG